MNQTEDRLPSAGAPQAAALSRQPSASPEESRVIRAVQDYLALMEVGRQPERKEFVNRYPDIAEALAECLAGLDFVHAAAPELSRPPGDAGALGNIPLALPLGDFRLVREIGRGGMGVVYEAEQLSLSRRVALKVLPFAAALDAKQLQRFKNEAQAAAHLHHTNIVPVFGVGCERGVHFYAMQFIEGQTLAALIRQLRHAAGLDAAEPEGCGADAAALPQALASGQLAPASRSRAEEPPTGPYTHLPAQAQAPPAAATPQPAAPGSTERSTKDPAFFRTVANLGVQAAEALEHAHQLGVVHRDIKPANLLVDAGGRLWVTDFGLAHVQSQVGLTMTGDLVGTLRYMSPEQALAKRVIIDHRTDIYSIGVTLYELLTLQPAFGGNDRQELLRQIAFEEPRPPRRRNQSMPAELETIVLKAMEKNPGERYATAQQLADDLERFLKDEPIWAKRPTLPQRARKWARRHKPLVWSAAVSAAVLSVMAAAALMINYVLVSQERDQKQEALNQKEEALRQKQEALNQKEKALEQKQRALIEADQALKREQQAKERADNNLRKARKAVNDYLLMTATDPRLTDADLALLRKSLLATAIPFFEEFVKQKEGDAELEAERGLAYYQLAFVRSQLGEHQQALADYEQARAVFAQLAKNVPATPADRRLLGVSHSAVGTTLLTLGKLADAEEAYRKALALQEKLRDEAPDHLKYGLDLALTHANLALLLGQRAKPAEAEKHYRKALDLRAKLAADFPFEPRCRQALALSHVGVGLWLNKMGKGPEALTHHCQALEILDELVVAFPGAPGYRHDLATSHTFLGDLMRDQRKFAKAEAHYGQALAILRKLTDDFPSVHEYRHQFGRAQFGLAAVLLHLDKRTEAQEALRHTLEIQQKLVDQLPNVPLYQMELADTYNSLGLLLHDLGKPNDAESAFRKALALAKNVAPEVVNSSEWHNVLGGFMCNLARELADLKRLPEARQLLEQAIDHQRTALNSYPNNPRYRLFLRTQYWNLAETLVRMEEHAAAAKAAAELPCALPDDWEEYHRAAWFLLRCIDLAEKDSKLLENQRQAAVLAYANDAKEHIRQAIKRAKDTPKVHSTLGADLNDLAVAMKKHGRLADARQLLEQAIDQQQKALKADPRQATYRSFLRNHYWNLARTLLLLGEHAEAAKAADELPRIFPEGWEEYFSAARLLALCVPLAQKDAKLTEDKRKDLARAYADRAMAGLRQAVAKGFNNLASLKQHQALDPLRAREDFKKLIAELEKGKSDGQCSTLCPAVLPGPQACPTPLGSN
jgi:serine/threonine protein kinase